MADSATTEPPGLTILIKQHKGRIDIRAGLVTVEELAESLKRAGITHLKCLEVRGHKTEDGGSYEELEFASAYLEETP